MTLLKYTAPESSELGPSSGEPLFLWISNLLVERLSSKLGFSNPLSPSLVYLSATVIMT